LLDSGAGAGYRPTDARDYSGLKVTSHMATPGKESAVCYCLVKFMIDIFMHTTALADCAVITPSSIGARSIVMTASVCLFPR